MPKIKHYTAAEAAALRKKMWLNQSEFWGRFGVTQSGGSRYESGRDIPPPVQILLNIALLPRAKSSMLVDRLIEMQRKG